MLSSGGGVWDDIPSFDTVAAEWKPRGETLTSASVHARYSGGGGYDKTLDTVKEAPRTKKMDENTREDDFFSFDAYHRAFSEKTSFFDLSAHNIVKKRSKNLEIVGSTLSIFVLKRPP